MPTNFKQFSRDLTEFSKDVLPAQFLMFQKRLYSEVISRTVFRTPVKTGRLRGGWQLSVEGTATEVDTLDPNGQSTVNRGLKALFGLQPFQTVTISNLVSHVSFIEFGTEKISPRLMLTTSLQEVETLFRKER